MPNVDEILEELDDTNADAIYTDVDSNETDEVPKEELKPEPDGEKEVEEEVIDYSKKPDRLRKLALKMGFREDGELDDATFIDNERHINITQAGTIRRLRQEQIELKKLVGEGFKAQLETRNRQIKEEIENLQGKRDDAIENADKEEVHRLDREIETRSKYIVEPEKPKEDNLGQDEQKEIFKEWNKENTWYGQNDDLTEVANGLGREIWDKNPSLTYEEVLRKITQKVNRLAGEKTISEPMAETPKKDIETLTNQGVKPKIKRSNTVESGHQTKQTPKKKITEADLTASQIRAAKEHIRLGLFTTVQEYINEMHEDDKNEILKRKER